MQSGITEARNEESTTRGQNYMERNAIKAESRMMR